MTYSTRAVAVRGGSLTVASWRADDTSTGSAAPAVLALHGVTATHQEWPMVAERVAASGSYFIAPDLRGRGRSSDLPGPWGLANHAADFEAALDAHGVDQAVVVGHSMGGFAAVVFAHRYPSRTAALVLIDGGIPIPPPPGVTPEEFLTATIGPAAERLRLRFPSTEAYFDFWRDHPALRDDWSPVVERYLAYDLVGEEPQLRSSVSYDAIAADSLDLSGEALVAAWQGLRVPTLFLRAPAGLRGEPPGLYPAEVVRAWAASFPELRWHDVEGVNHYTITLTARGADAVADAIRSVADRAPTG